MELPTSMSTTASKGCESQYANRRADPSRTLGPLLGSDAEISVLISLTYMTRLVT